MKGYLPIHERFHTFQGEGVHMGRSAFFIRTMGCPVKCNFCDSAGTWHPNWKPKEDTMVPLDVLVREALDADPCFVVLTGGEPAVHDLQDLTVMLHDKGIFVHLETCGAFPIRGQFDWITVSPKDAAPPTTDNVVKAKEFKIIVEVPYDINRWYGIIKAHEKQYYGHEGPAVIWLHPEWSKREDQHVLQAITEAVKRNRRFRAGWQMHKLFNADALDDRSKTQVPLGGIQR